MSEIVFAVLRGEDMKSIALRRIGVLTSYNNDLFRRVTENRDQIDVIRQRREYRDNIVAMLRSWLRHGVKERLVARYLFAYDFLSLPLSYSQVRVEWQEYTSRDLLRRILSATSINYSSALASPLAFALMYNLSPFTLSQMIIAVDGLAGVGKTSLVYNSVKSVLLALGFSEKEVQELFLAMYVQRVDEFIEMMRVLKDSEVYRKVRIPILVFDDAAVTASAYMWFTESRRKMIEFARALTIAREKIANLLIIGPYSATFKGIRRLAHMVFEPSTYYDLLPKGVQLVTSLWYVSMRDKVVDLTATITPHPMKVDDTVYSLITAVKKKLWEEVVEKAGATVESEQKGEEE
jgi:hypothetical protein